LSLITIRHLKGDTPTPPPGVPRGQIPFFQKLVKFGIKLIRKLRRIKTWYLLVLYVARRSNFDSSGPYKGIRGIRTLFTVMVTNYRTNDSTTS